MFRNRSEQGSTIAAPVTSLGTAGPGARLQPSCQLRQLHGVMAVTKAGGMDSVLLASMSWRPLALAAADAS